MSEQFIAFRNFVFPYRSMDLLAFRISKVLASDSASDWERKRFGTKVPEKGGCWGKLGGGREFFDMVG